MKIIDYINKNNVEDIIAAVIRNKRDPAAVYEQVKQSSTEFIRKTVELRHRLEELMEQKSV